jgi:hypothetical protein
MDRRAARPPGAGELRHHGLHVHEWSPAAPGHFRRRTGELSPAGRRRQTAQVDDGDSRQASGVDAGREALQKIVSLNFVRKNRIN